MTGAERRQRRAPTPDDAARRRAHTREEFERRKAEARDEFERRRAEFERRRAAGEPVIAPPMPDPASAPSTGVSNWNIANALTMFRIVLVPVFGWLLLTHGGHDTGYRIGAVLVFAIASITDRIDGDLARSRGLVTDFGKMMDPIADKALMGMALIGLSIIGRLPWWVTGVILVREIGITLLRLSVIKHGVLPASRGGKLKTFLQAIAIGLFLLPIDGWFDVIAWVVMLAALAVTVATGVDYVFRAIRLRRNSERSRQRRARRAARRRE
ncbi:CDP-diacylglycerol--glycerol-3-phosphate 3-phosphatidyltransferase [Flexivirga sp.]|uniref:CDP-diacylglycerol--glycerol-3-phosphate 3-phosphatidyltransferase n=1 Tax=Flexivirga sp. TaxID=1962927 RepID=UPI003F7FFD72